MSETTVGSLDEVSPDVSSDFKSPAYSDLDFRDLLFVHAPSDVWAAYDDVGDDSGTLGEHIAEVGGPLCYDDIDGHALSAGTVEANGELCSTRLFFNAIDHDGASCDSEFGDEDSWGPTWSTGGNNGCPFDDPGRRGGLGPVRDHPDTEFGEGEWGNFDEFGPGLGFGGPRAERRRARNRREPHADVGSLGSCGTQRQKRPALLV